MNTSSRMSGTSPIRAFYFCYPHNRPTGGQKHTYEHVDILNQHGIDAFAFHPAEDFRLSWFQNQTRVVSEQRFRTLHDPARDVVVLPEDLPRTIRGYSGPKVIFNKGFVNGFAANPGDNSATSMHDVVAILAVSEHNRAHLQHAFPRHPVLLVSPAINPEVFKWRALGAKQPKIAIAAKNRQWVAALREIVRARADAGYSAANEFEWIVLDGKTERETAAALADSVILIFLNVAEGLGRLPLEAMSCGCLVVAWKCGPLRETLPAAVTFEYADLIEMVNFIERVTAAFPDGLAQWTPLAEAGRDVARSFSIERQRRSVIAAWEVIRSLARPEAFESVLFPPRRER